MYHGYKLLRRTTRQVDGIRMIQTAGQRTYEIIFKWQFENTSPVPCSLVPVPPPKNIEFFDTLKRHRAKHDAVCLFTDY